jgi:hypothetical protein
MQPDWLAAQNYQQAQTIVAAINDLSIGLKLGRRGVRSPERERATATARHVLRSFLDNFQALTEQAESAADKPLVGTAPALSALARTFAEVRKGSLPRLHHLCEERIDEIRSFLDSEDAAGQDRLLVYLAELRILLEQQIDVEVGRIMGEL